MNDERRDALIRVSSLVAGAQHILITSHVGPDGDAIGACLALHTALRRLDKSVTVWLADPVPDTLRFLPDIDAISPVADAPPAGDLVFALDMSELSRTGPVEGSSLFGVMPVVNVDHHLSNQYFGTVNIVDPEAAATCEVIVQVLQAIGVDVDTSIATPLLAGLISDTLGFRTSNTSVQTMRLAADLMERGAPLTDLSDAVFKNHSLPQLRLWGSALTTLQSRLDGRIVWTVIDQALAETAGASMELAEGAVNLLASAREVDAAIVFKRHAEGMTRVSVRTNGQVNAAAACEAFGGGGHARAAGCTLPAPSPEVEQQFLDYLEQALIGAPAAAGDAHAATTS